MDTSTERAARAAAIRTFLIADIRGYTRFTAQHGDEAASRLTGLFAQVAAEGIEAWGGELVELRGDEALSVFDSPRQALRAAVELQSAFADETRTDPDLPLGVGIGLDAGEAVPVGGGYRGAALNLAARLCSVATAGEVLASDSLIHLAGQVDGLDYRPAEPAPFKGYDEPIPAVRVSARGDAGSGTSMSVAGPQGPVPALPPELDPIVPLAGRERELRWLRWHWRRASHGHGRVVVLSGPPGIGKTRLAAELASIAHEGGAEVIYLPAARLAPSPPAETQADRPLLTVVDDLDAATSDAVGAVVERARDLPGRPGMFLVTHRREAPPQLVAVAERMAPTEGRRTLGPIDADAVRTIVALYAGHATEEAPIGDLVTESGGVPAAVHRVASQWARTAAAGRLGTSADRTAAGRRGLRDAETALIGDVADLELARERERLYALDPADGDGAAALSRTICPYKGLAEFEAADADYYFGRERLVAELIARFVGGSFLGLVGDCGSGKSSALRAGLLPALAGGVLPGSDTWPQALLRPGEHPTSELLRALARALPQAALPPDDASAALDAALASLASGQRLVLVVDQFEEVFNATRDDAERSGFIDVLTAQRAGLKVIVAIRADHYGRCAAYPALARLLGSDQVLVGPLSDTELAAVIEHPAQRVGLRVEPALTEALVADAGTEPGVLPLLSTCLLELWGVRDAGRLTLAAYRASGGLQGAIARLAEATYAELDPHRQTVARALLLRLAGPGEGAELVRRRVSLEELDVDADPVLSEVLGTLTEARLLTTGDGHVEVAHEALLREWPRLQGWLAEDAAGREVRLHLIGAVHDWQARGRESSDLYRGARLAAALEWSAEHQVELNASERAFLDESRRLSEREVERQRRLNRRLRVLLAGAAVLLVVAVAAGGFAFLQGQRAEQQSQVAQQEASNARSRELLASALAVRDQDPTLSKLLAVEAMNVVVTPTYQSTSVLHQVLAGDPVTVRYDWPDEGPDGPWTAWTDIDRSGRLLVASGWTAYPTTYLEVADALTGTMQWLYKPAYEPRKGAVIGQAWFSADGSQVIAGLFWADPGVAPPSDVLGALIWDAHSGELLKRIDLGPCGGVVVDAADSALLVRAPSPGPDGHSGCHWPDDPDGPAVDVVDPLTGASKRLADRAYFGSSDGTLSGDGRFAAFDVDEAGTLTSVVVNVVTGERVFTHPGDGGARTLNRDGTLLLYGSDPVVAYDISDPKSPGVPGPSGGAVTFTEFDPAGAMVYETFLNRVLRLWDPRTGNVLDTWPNIGNGRPSVAADGRTVLVPDISSATGVLLDSGARGESGQVQTCQGNTLKGSLEVRGGLAAFGEFDCSPEGRLVQVVDLQQRTLVASLPGWFAQDLAISPDGGSFVSQEVSPGTILGPLKVADLRTGSLILELKDVCQWDNSGTVSTPPDQQPGCHTYPQTPFPFLIAKGGTQWSPDGTLIAGLGQDVEGGGNLAVWNAVDGHLIFKAPKDPGQNVYQMIFTPDSKRLVVSFDTGTVETLSTETWTTVTTTQLDKAAFDVIHLGFVGFSQDGATILAVAGFGEALNASLLWLDADTLQIKTTPAPVPGLHNGLPVFSLALSPNGLLMATGGAADSLVRVWETRTGERKQQMDFGDLQIQGMAFVDDGHLAVTPAGGGLLIMTIDPAELANTVRASLTRTFKAEECTTYGINPCPTLEEMRAP